MKHRFTVCLSIFGGCAVAAALWSAGPAAASSDLTWTGLSTSPYWSQADNWSGTVPINDGTYGTLTLGGLTATCDSGSTDTCYESNNDLSGISVSGISVGSSDHYELEGNDLAIGSGGITASPPASGSGESDSSPVITAPLTLGAAQTWSIDGGTNQAGGLYVNTASGSYPLTVELASHAFLGIGQSLDAGSVSLSGDGTVDMDGSIDESSGGPVSVSDGAVLNPEVAGLQSGPLSTSDGGDIIVGGGKGFAPEATLQVNGAVDLDSTSSLGLYIDSPGSGSGTDSDPAPGTDYSQLTATGDIDLNDAHLTVSQGVDSEGVCVDLHPGDVYTLLSTTGGTISGTFAGLANGATVDMSNPCVSSSSATGQISYNSSSVTLTILTGGHAGDLPQLKGTGIKISGKPVVGYTLKTNHGSWTNSPKSYKYSWRSCPTDGACKVLKDSKDTLLLTPSLTGRRVYVVVTAKNKYGSDGYGSDSTKDIVDPSQAQIKKQLHKLLQPTGARSMPSALAKSGHYEFRYTAPYGRVSLSWMSGKTKVASGSAHYKRTGAGKLTVKLTGAGKKLVKQAAEHHRKLKLTASASANGTGTKTVKASGKFTL